MIKKMKKEHLLIVVLFGMLLLVISIPTAKEEPVLEKNLKKEEQMIPEENPEQRLKEVLQKIKGVGRVEILITYEDKGRLVVEKDEIVSEELIEEADSSGGQRKTTTVQQEYRTIYRDDETPYVIREIAPKVEGVLVVAEGGGNIETKKQITTAIEALFGLEAHKISIMKMEVLK